MDAMTRGKEIDRLILLNRQAITLFEKKVLSIERRIECLKAEKEGIDCGVWNEEWINAFGFLHIPDDGPSLNDLIKELEEKESYEEITHGNT